MNKDEKNIVLRFNRPRLFVNSLLLSVDVKLEVAVKISISRSFDSTKLLTWESLFNT